jgi:hypothetical protein
LAASITNRELNSAESALAVLSLFYAGLPTDQIELTQIQYYTMKAALKRTLSELEQLWQEKQSER